MTLAPEAAGTVAVDYATSDGTATAEADYTATTGTLTFTAGQTSKTIAVPIVDDTVEDNGETVNLALSNASGAQLGDSQATGTIRNTEAPGDLTASFQGRAGGARRRDGVPLPRGTQRRDQDQLQDGARRVVHGDAEPGGLGHGDGGLRHDGREPGFRGRFAGRELRPGMERDVALDVVRQLGASAGANTLGPDVHDPLFGGPAEGSVSLQTPGLGGSTPMMGA